MLSTINFQNPLLWAVFIGWILSVVLHEFAHGLVAYLGGDYTIRERGGLTLNPLQYIDPVFSLLFPAIIFAMGGIPLPGGVTYVRRDLIRSRGWNVAVSAAGPAMNFLLFLLCALPFHPRVQLMIPTIDFPNWHLFLGTMAILQLLATLFNLVPVPPLDGFQIISQFMNPATRAKFQQAGTTLFLVFFLMLWNVPSLRGVFYTGANHTMAAIGLDEQTSDYFASCYDRVLFNEKSTP